MNDDNWNVGKKSPFIRGTGSLLLLVNRKCSPLECSAKQLNVTGEGEAYDAQSLYATTLMNIRLVNFHLSNNFVGTAAVTQWHQYQWNFACKLHDIKKRKNINF